MRGNAASRFVRALEWALLGIGLGCFAWLGRAAFEIHRLQSEADVAVKRMIEERARGPRIELPSPSPRAQGLVGQLDIPRLHLSAAVMEGDGDRVLASAIGYLPDTPLPWQPGNSALAAHRDRLFRPLERIRVGDDIWLATPQGDFHYRVRRTFIVEPTEVWVLDPLPDVDLTLITCFPFVYVGHAPHRFIVQAEKLWPSAEGNSREAGF